MKAYNPTKIPPIRCRLGWHKWEEHGTVCNDPYGYANYCIHCGGVQDENHPHARPDRMIIQGWHSVGIV